MMKLSFLIVLVIFASASTASAQSYWERTPVTNFGSFVAAADSNDYVFSGSFFPPQRSTDYGASWQPTFSNGISRMITSIVHPSHNLIVIGCNDVKTVTVHQGADFSSTQIVAGAIIRSLDGGRNFNETVLGSTDTDKVHNPIGAIAALDSNHIFIPVGGDHYLHTSDGGASWLPIPCPVTQHFSIGSPDIGIQNPVAAYPAKNTLIVAEVDTSFPYANYASKIYRSTDLGTTWSDGFQTHENINCFAFINPLVGFAAGGYFASQIDITAIIEKTTDGGLSWSRVYASKFDLGVEILSIAFADSLNGLAVGQHGVVLRTTDGGATWSQQKADIGSTDPGAFKSVAYPSPTHAIIAAGFGDAWIYRPKGLLDMPTITYPSPDAQVLPSEFDATWTPIAGATSYTLWLISAADNSMRVNVLGIAGTTYHLAGFNTDITGQDYNSFRLYVQAVNADNKSNSGTRQFYVRAPAKQSVSSDAESTVPIQIYPNPATTEFHVGLNNEDHCAGAIFDVIGRKIMEFNAPDVHAQLPSGIYTLRCWDGKKCFSNELVIRTP